MKTIAIGLAAAILAGTGLSGTALAAPPANLRSEERRVGKECA